MVVQAAISYSTPIIDRDINNKTATFDKPLDWRTLKTGQIQRKLLVSNE